MNCLTSGILGIGMLGATYATMSVSDEKQNYLKSIFPDNFDRIYEKIILERRNHYIQGLILGLLLAVVIISNVETSNTFHRITLFTLVTIAVSVLYYCAVPKSDYMLNHLDTQEQTKAWLSVYKTMKQRYLVGFILGSLAAIPIANSLCN